MINKEHFEQLIGSRQLKVGIIGLGYVGLPVSATIAKQGFHVVGLDINKERVELINDGTSPIKGKEPGLAELIAKVTETTLEATTDVKRLADRDLVIVAVDTPVEEGSKLPEYKALKAAIETFARVMKENVLLIIESTIAPGTIRKIVVPLIESVSKRKLNESFYIGHCPERVTPGKLLYNLENYARVVGGSSPEVAQVMKHFYSTYVKGELDTTDVSTAEMVKTTENYYRDVEIAFANQLALNCEYHGVDFYRVRELVNKVEARNVHYPGTGVGGHCIPKDGLLNVAFLRKDRGDDVLPVRFSDLAREVNDFMPYHIVELLEDAVKEAGIEMDQAKVLLLGYSFLPDSDDVRNSPSIAIVNALKERVGSLKVYDPFVSEYSGDLDKMIEGINAVILATAHSEFKNSELLPRLSGSMNTKILIDGRNVFDKNKALEFGFVYKGIGNI